MKGKMLIRMAFVLLFAGMATSSKAQSLNEIFGNIKDQVGNLFNQVTVTETSILGKWTYLQPACEFKSENLLAQAGGTAAATKVEDELAAVCTKLGIESGNTSFEFKEDGTYIQTIKGKETKGTYTFDKTNMMVVMKGTLGFSTTAYLKFSKDKMTLVYEADKVWEIAKQVASIASKFMDSTLLTIFNSVSDNYEGMRLGFDLQKAN